ncbi:hypothetical protein DPMN_159144 [Dreissena polymorpha]|uniref:Uncharacterized protein n=1 Tax=Dreissena polymorpha TaxID=45954 RepID=A0A9D4EJ65_DREPO|nr:hypothetical protein DPMN_159144 [Dreissena polymorpha]
MSTVKNELKSEKTAIDDIATNIRIHPPLADVKCERIYKNAITADLLLISEDVRVFRDHLLEAIENTKQYSLEIEHFEILYKGLYRRMVPVVQRQITAFTRARRLVNK